jgi:hypothetical protein
VNEARRTKVGNTCCRHLDTFKKQLIFVAPPLPATKTPINAIFAVNGVEMGASIKIYKFVNSLLMKWLGANI